MPIKTKSYELSISQLKKYPGFENVTDDEANETIQALKELSLICYAVFQKQEARKKQIRAK